MRLTVFLFSLFVIVACTSDISKYREFFVLTDSSEEIVSGAFVKSNRKEIGRIKKVELLHNDQYLLQIYLTGNAMVPVDSEFNIRSGLWSKSYLNIVMGRSDTLLTLEDTVAESKQNLIEFDKDDVFGELFEDLDVPPPPPIE